MKRVIAALSGGVDSAVAAHLLKSQGFEVIGVTIKTWSGAECSDERAKGCCSVRDIQDARQAARALDIPYYVMDLSADFREKVIDYFVDGYLQGRTPNPCIECNRTIKFGVLMDKADELGAEFVATGHYARKRFDASSGRYHVAESEDLSKDQSYVLFGLSQEQLKRSLFPVGEMKKLEVRAAAHRLGLRVHDKPDSQEICFVKGSYVDFVRGFAPERLPGEGDLVASDGRTLGTHAGSHAYTIGQRKRIEVTDRTPYFVTGIDATSNRVTIGKEPELYTERMAVGRINWMLQPRTGDCTVKIRYRHDKAPARIVEAEQDRVSIVFQTPQKAVTPGQAAVFYDGSSVIGGGWIQ